MIQKQVNTSGIMKDELSDIELKVLKGYKTKTGVGSGRRTKPRNGNKYVKFYRSQLELLRSSG